MNKNLTLSVIVVIVLSVVTKTMMVVTSSYATDGILKKNQPKLQNIQMHPSLLPGIIRTSPGGQTRQVTTK